MKKRILQEQLDASRASVSPVTETVSFDVSIKATEREGKWIAVTLETGIIAVGDTEQEAMTRAEKWNMAWMSVQKANGYDAMKESLDARGISFRLDSPTRAGDEISVRV